MLGEDNGQQYAVPDGDLDAGVEAPEWVVAKSLLDVENTTTNTLESFLLYATTDRADDLPVGELQDQLDELIAKQERATAELELAKRALAEIEE